MLRMQNIHKAYGANVVLKGVNFKLGRGEICALLGENGAGKSTLMNILGGVTPADSGQILIDDKPLRIHNPADAQKNGIAFIHQELNLVNDLSIYENLFLGRELLKNGFLDTARMCDETTSAFRRIGLNLNPKTLVRFLDASYKQIVEIVKALMLNASIIIMDEPTTSLTDTEIERVFDMMKTLRQQKVGIIFISHKLKEVLKICDTYFILRDGAPVASGAVSTVTAEDLAKHMVGREIQVQARTSFSVKEQSVLRCEKLSKDGMFKDISFSVNKGEILGFTGLLGDGRSELFQTIFGCQREDSGALFLEDRPLQIKNTKDAVAKGIGYVPKNRKENAIIKDMSILENGTVVTWSSMTKMGLIDRQLQKKCFSEHVKSLNIKMEKDSNRIGSLSGGNQQKVVLAKWLGAHPKVLILDNPTQGVDVGAKEEIYQIITGLAEKGMAIVILSNEAQEIIRVCDRVLVLYHGVIQGELAGEAMTEQNMMHLATGGSLHERSVETRRDR